MESSSPVLGFWGLGDRPSKSSQEGDSFRQQPLGCLQRFGDSGMLMEERDPCLQGIQSLSTAMTPPDMVQEKVIRFSKGPFSSHHKPWCEWDPA